MGMSGTRSPGASSPAHSGRRHALVVALIANAVAAAVKIGAFLVTGPSVLLSEGLHSIADCGNQAALLLGHRDATSRPSARHPLGRGRVRYLWAFLVAVVIFGGSAAGALAEATYRLLNPAHAERLDLTLAALGVALVIEAASFTSALRAARATKGDASWVGFVLRSRDPDLPVLLVEDVADLVGLGLAIVGSILAAVTGAPVLDAVASYLIGTVLAANAVFLAWEMGSLILGEAPEPEVEQAIRAAVGDDGDPGRGPRVQAIHLGPDELLVIIEVSDAPGGPTGNLLERLEQAAERVTGATPLRTRVLFEVRGREPPL
jgi:cation diffusion facilitator family transporter